MEENAGGTKTVTAMVTMKVDDESVIDGYLPKLAHWRGSPPAAGFIRAKREPMQLISANPVATSAGRNEFISSTTHCNLPQCVAPVELLSSEASRAFVVALSVVYPSVFGR